MLRASTMLVMLLLVPVALFADDPKSLRVGIIGLDTSHATAFAKALNSKTPAEGLGNCRVVAAYPQGSKDIVSSASRIPRYTEQMKEYGVEICPSIKDLLSKVDVVLLETNDGRPHLEQAAQVIKAGKPLFVDKPISASLVDAVAIFEFAKKHKVPVFSSSSLRFSSGAQAIRNGSIGEVTGCDAYSPASLEKTHPDLFWYGIHGVETLFTVMGSGCKTVSRTHTENYDVVVGRWSGERIGTFRGIRHGGAGYGGTAFGTKGVSPIGKYEGYTPLLIEIVKFFRSGKPPVSAEETLEIYAFMHAADESKAQDGKAISIADSLEVARKQADVRMNQLGIE